MGASLLELKLSALCLAAVFVQSAVNLRGPSHALSRVLDAGDAPLGYRITTLAILLVVGTTWTATQWVWIIQPRQVGFARSLPIARGTELFAIGATLAFTDLLLLGLIADATVLAAAGTGDLAAATARVVAGVTLGASLFVLQWCVLMRAFAIASGMATLAVFAALPALSHVVEIATCMAAIGLQMLLAVSAARSAARVRETGDVNGTATRLALHWPLAALPVRILVGELRRGVGLRLGLLLLVQAFAIAAVNAAAPGTSNDIALVSLHLMGFLLASKLCDTLLQARSRSEPFLRSLPRSPRFWGWMDGIAVAAVAMVCGLPVWVFALSTGYIEAAPAARIVMWSIIPLALFIGLRTTAIRGRGGYLVLVWLLSTWAILA